VSTYLNLPDAAIFPDAARHWDVGALELFGDSLPQDGHPGKRTGPRSEPTSSALGGRGYARASAVREEVRVGGRAGILAGLVYAVVEAAEVVTLLVAFKSRVIEVIGSELPSGSTGNSNATYNLLVATDAVIAIVFGIVAGLLLGLLFGAVSNRVPGRRWATKGLVFGVALWLILHVIADYFANLKYGVTFYLVDISLGLATSLVYGILLGIFFEREWKKLATPGRSPTAHEEGSTDGSPASRP